jgi:hypothetical protein
VVVAKVGAGMLAVALTRRPLRRLGTLAAIGGALLAIYGAVLAGAGALVLTGAVSAAPTDERALRWHTLLWDRFLVWGLALAVAGVSARQDASRSSVPRRRDPTVEADRRSATPPCR